MGKGYKVEATAHGVSRITSYTFGSILAAIQYRRHTTPRPSRPQILARSKTRLGLPSAWAPPPSQCPHPSAPTPPSPKPPPPRASFPLLPPRPLTHRLPLAPAPPPPRPHSSAPSPSACGIARAVVPGALLHGHAQSHPHRPRAWPWPGRIASRQEGLRVIRGVDGIPMSGCLVACP